MASMKYLLEEFDYGLAVAKRQSMLWCCMCGVDLPGVHLVDPLRRMCHQCDVLTTQPPPSCVICGSTENLVQHVIMSMGEPPDSPELNCARCVDWYRDIAPLLWYTPPSSILHGNRGLDPRRISV